MTKKNSIEYRLFREYLDKKGIPDKELAKKIRIKIPSIKKWKEEGIPIFVQKTIVKIFGKEVEGFFPEIQKKTKKKIDKPKEIKTTQEKRTAPRKGSYYERVTIKDHKGDIVFSNIVKKTSVISRLKDAYPPKYYSYEFTECNY